MDWDSAAKYCEHEFGGYVDLDEGFFICPLGQKYLNRLGAANCTTMNIMSFKTRQT